MRDGLSATDADHGTWRRNLFDAKGTGMTLRSPSYAGASQSPLWRRLTDNHQTNGIPFIGTEPRTQFEVGQVRSMVGYLSSLVV